MFEVFFDGNSIEVWRISFSSGRRVMLTRHRLTVMATLLAYSPRVHRGPPRSLAQVLDQDCNEVIDLPGAPWHGYTFEQAAQYFPDDCDNLVDTQSYSGMLSKQIQLRLYLTVRRQFLELLRKVKAEMQDCDFSNLD